MHGIINGIILRSVILVSSILIASNINAASLYSRNGGGNWNSANTWSYSSTGGASCTCTPAAGDSVTIRASELVFLSSSPTISGSPMKIFVLGTWRFDNPAKLTIPTGSVVTIEIGGVLDNNGGNGHNNYLTIGITEVWYAQLGDKNGYLVYTDTPTPVELLYFNVKAADSKVHISWATAQEINNKGFEIEKSYDGVSFYTLTYIDGKGNSTSQNSYQTEDTDLKAKIIYYRLKQIDFSGHSETYRIKSAILNNWENKMSLFPNPSQKNEVIFIELPNIDTNQETTIELIDKLGQVIYSRVCNNYDRGNSFIIDPNNNLSGCFILKAINNQQVYQQKILIQ